MAVAHVAFFGSANSKTAGTSLAITGSQALNVGDDIFITTASDTGGTGYTPSTNAGPTVTFTQEDQVVLTGQIEVKMHKGRVTGAGTLTTLTMTWTTNVTAKALVAGVFSGIDTLKWTGTDTNASSTDVGAAISNTPARPWVATDFVVGAVGYEGPGTDNLTVSESATTASLTSVTEEGQDGTTGGLANTNITAQLVWAIATGTNDATGDLLLTHDATAARGNAAVGAAYSAAAAVSATPPVAWITA